jgi:membrane associated rhomboid family serine protease
MTPERYSAPMSSDEYPPNTYDPIETEDRTEEDEPSGSNQRIRLLKGGGILLEPAGFRIIEARGIKRSPLHTYESITHVAVTERALLVGTTSGLTILRASDFPDPKRGPEEARAALLARLAARPDGEFALERVERLERLSNRRSRNWAIWTSVALCLLATIAQLRDPMVVEYGSFVPDLFGNGEVWRAVTSHFLHGLPRFPVHLAVNVGGLLVLGYLVERPLGTAKTIVVLAIGGVGTIVGSIYYGYQEVVGASGLVSALVGAMLALEWHHPETLPAYWRIPRRIFVVAIVIQFLVIDQIFSNYLAGGAHIGGFIGGYAAIWLVRGPISSEVQSRSLLRTAALSAFLVVGLGVSPIVSLALHDESALERHGLRLLNSPTALGIEHDNAIAWFIVTEGDPSPTGLDVAVALASRAVDATGRMNPNVLDTLAEVFFRAGDSFAAVLTIEEAIRLAPMEPYFYEQRKRFTGERAADDRPTPPGEGDSGDSSEGEDGEMIFDPDAPSITL